MTIDNSFPLKIATLAARVDNLTLDVVEAEKDVFESNRLLHAPKGTAWHDLVKTDQRGVIKRPSFQGIFE